MEAAPLNGKEKSSERGDALEKQRMRWQIRSGMGGRSKFVALNFILSPLSRRGANFYEIFSPGIICDGFLFQEMVRLGRDYDSSRPRM